VAIELPGPVIDFLNFIGVDFPRVNEDHVREFATHVRTFASNIEDTHTAATGTVQRMSGAYTGASYEALVARWSQMSSSHMQELIEICGTVATALDVAAGYIEGKKYEAIAQLGVMAAAFVADQAAAIATFGIAEAAEVAIVAGAKEVTKFLEQELEQYIIGEVIEKAVTPLEGVVEKAVNGLMFSAASSVLGGGGGAVGASFGIHPDDLAAHAAEFKGHSDAVAGHAQELAGKLSSLSFDG
jgi:uncharacterized protein YukE